MQGSHFPGKPGISGNLKFELNDQWRLNELQLLLLLLILLSWKATIWPMLAWGNRDNNVDYYDEKDKFC